jgi:TonB family protein
MAFRALLFSKNAETNTAMTAACGNTGIRVEVRSDIFTAIDLVKIRAFSCVIVDWADQPEATFLLKRARESGSNLDTVAIAIVDHEPSPAEMRDNRLDFLIYRPIADEEAGAVLTKASEKMRPGSVENDEASLSIVDKDKIDGSTLGGTNDAQQGPSGESAERAESGAADGDDNGDSAVAGEQLSAGRRSSGLIIACVAIAAIGAVLFLLKSNDMVGHLSQTPGQSLRGVRDSIATLFSKHQTVPVNQSTNEASQDTYFNRDTNSTGQQPALDVVATTSTLAESTSRLPKAFDFPLPEPVLERPQVAPVRVQRAAIPDSMKASPPIAPPVVVTVNPAQMMPVSAPVSQPTTQQISEPVAVSEEAARALLVHSVNPIYPAEGLPQKLHGAVVLQAVIGREGNVEDLKIVRGYFVLGRAAIAAVKQWRFQPYTINGHAVSTQTVVTVNFSYPPG